MVKKTVNIEAKASLQLPFRIKEIDSRYPKSYRPSIKKDKKYKANWKHQNRTKIKLSPIISFLRINSFKSKLLRKTSVIKTVKKTIKPLESTLTRWQKKTSTKIRLNTWVTPYAILVRKKATIPISVPKSQKTNGSLGNLHVNDWKENRRKIRANILYLVFC